MFSAGGPCEQFWQGQGCPLFHIVQPAFPLPATTLPILQSALRNGFGEAVVTCDMLELCQFPSLDSFQKKFLWTHKQVDLAPYPVIGLVLQEGNAEKFPQALGFPKP